MLEPEAGSDYICNDLVDMCKVNVATLFYFEKICVNNAIEKSVLKSFHDWINLLVDKLFAISSPDLFVLEHAVLCRGVSLWSNFVRFPQVVEKSPTLEMVQMELVKSGNSDAFKEAVLFLVLRCFIF